MVVETHPLYKDLETWDVSPGSLFYAVFVCILSENRRPGKRSITQLIDTKGQGMHPCIPFRNSNLIFYLFIPLDAPWQDSRQLGAVYLFIGGR